MVREIQRHKLQRQKEEENTGIKKKEKIRHGEVGVKEKREGRRRQRNAMSVV